MAPSIKLSNLVTGLMVMTFLLISFLCGIYGILKHRERNKKKQMWSIVARELAMEQDRETVWNVERGRVREGKGDGRREGGKSGNSDERDLVRGRGGDKGLVEDIARGTGNERDLDTEIGKVRITINGNPVDPETRYQVFAPVELDAGQKTTVGWAGQRKGAHELEEKSAYQLQSQEWVADAEGAGERKSMSRRSLLRRQELAA